jgi:hypothetical protein
MAYKNNCAFVNFTTRDAAVLASNETFEHCVVNGRQLRVQWAKPKAGAISGTAGASSMLTVSTLPYQTRIKTTTSASKRRYFNTAAWIRRHSLPIAKSKCDGCINAGGSRINVPCFILPV